MGPGCPTKKSWGRVEECDHSITLGDWDKPLKLWGTLGQWPHAKLTPTNKQTKSFIKKLATTKNVSPTFVHDWYSACSYCYCCYFLSVRAQQLTL
jgi:hypothetical protein